MRWRHEFDTECRAQGGHPSTHPCRWYEECSELYSAEIDAFGLTYTMHCCKCPAEPRKLEWAEQLYWRCTEECDKLYGDDPDTWEQCDINCIKSLDECMEKHHTREEVARCMLQ